MEEAKEEAAYTIIEFVKSPDMFQVLYNYIIYNIIKKVKKRYIFKI